MNEGKRFELAFKKSVPEGVFYFRIPDPAQAFSPSREGLRFSARNPCDAFLFNPATKTLYALELKSTKGASITYWREDFDDGKGTFMVRRNQIEGLRGMSAYSIAAGFVFNFRRSCRTYYQAVGDFDRMTAGLPKKSFNEADVRGNGGVVIGQKKLRANFRYDLESFLRQVCI